MTRLLCLTLFLVATLSFNLVVEDSTPELTAINWPFTTCGSGTWTPKTLTLDQTPSRNINDGITMKGVANDYIEFKQVDINVKVNGLFLHSETIPFVKTYDRGDAVEFKYNTLIPSFAPAGTYAIQFNHKDTKGKDNGCWALTFKI